VLVAVRLKVEIPRHFAKAFVADGFDHAGECKGGESAERH
jgi:hypothetical protein